MSQPQWYVPPPPTLIPARATLEILIPDFVKQTAEEKPVEGDELEVRLFAGVAFGTEKKKITEMTERVFSSPVF